MLNLLMLQSRSITFPLAPWIGRKLIEVLEESIKIENTRKYY